MGKIALGTVQFGLDYGISNTSGQVTIGEARKILEFAKEHDIDTLDTASGYGNSESALGKIGIDDFQVVTKTMPLQFGIANVLQLFHQSLADLNTTSVDGLLIHNIDDTKDKQFDTLYKELGKLKQDNLISKIGFSTYTPNQVDFLLGNFDFDLIQVPFNILDNRLVQSGHLKILTNKGIEVHARSVFLQGLLLMSKQNLPKKFSRWDSLWSLWYQWLSDNKITALEATIRYAMATSEISKVLVGVDTQEQLQEIVELSKDKGALPTIPKELFMNDVNLLNPSNWKI